MITVEQAYKIAVQDDPSQKVSSCLDFGDFWVFFLRPFYIPDNEVCLAGTTFPAINKSNGELFYYDITDDVDAYENAKEVKVKTLYDEAI